MSETASRFARLGRFTASSMLSSANVTARAFHLGLATGARAVARVAAAAEGVPGSGVALDAARTIESESAAAAQDAAQRAARSRALMRNGSSDLDQAEPSEGSEPQPDSTQPGPAQPGWLQLAADTATAPVGRLAGLGLTLGSDALKATAATPLGKAGLDFVLRRLKQGEEQKDALLVVVNDSGVAVARTSLSFAEAALRLPFGDTRQMRQALESSLEELRTLASAEEMHALLPVQVVDDRLREQAQMAVDGTPHAFLEALGARSWSNPVHLLRAALDDAGQLRVFALAYPRTFWLMASNVGKQVVAGQLSFQEMEAFLEGRRWAGQDPGHSAS